MLSGVALTPLGGITNSLREKTRLTTSNEQNKKQYQEYQNTIASQNAGTECITNRNPRIMLDFIERKK